MPRGATFCDDLETAEGCSTKVCASSGQARRLTDWFEAGGSRGRQLPRFVRAATTTASTSTGASSAAIPVSTVTSKRTLDRDGEDEADLERRGAARVQRRRPFQRQLQPDREQHVAALRTAIIAAMSAMKWNGRGWISDVQREEAVDAEGAEAVAHLEPGAELHRVRRDREIPLGADVRIAFEQHDADAPQRRQVHRRRRIDGLKPPTVSSRFAFSFRYTRTAMSPVSVKVEHARVVQRCVELDLAGIDVHACRRS